MTTPLQQAAQAMIDRWDSPLWKDQPHTAEYISALRLALDAEMAMTVEPVAWKAEQIDDYEIRVTSPEGEAWRLRCAEKGDIFNNFIWRWAQSMAGGKA